MDQLKEFTLASGSPRRLELLGQMGLEFSVLVTDIDESRIPGEEPKAYVTRMAREKAQAGVTMSHSDLPVLGADTIVLLDRNVLGKPVGPEEAMTMLQSLSGRDHEVMSAVAIAVPGADVVQTLNRTTVSFAPIPACFIESYCASEEPLDKAGAYAIQGQTGRYISHISGSYSSVMGLPVCETARLLEQAGVIR
jgi:septum formation protein